MLLHAPSEWEGYFIRTSLANAMSGSLEMSQQRSHIQKTSAGRETGGFLLGAEIVTLRQFFVLHNRGHSQSAPNAWERYCGLLQNPRGIVPYHIVPCSPLKYVHISKLVPRVRGSTEEACHLSNS